MNEFLSQKIRVLSLISILAVVFWHAYMAPLPTCKYSGFYLFQNLITSSLLRFSIPLFFAISGYLFFLKPFDYLARLKKRFTSLLIPYILWSTMGAIFIYSLLIVPAISQIINVKWEFSLKDFLKHITIAPVQYQFWFLRDLMALTVLSPVIYLMSKRVPFLWVSILAVLWFLLGDNSYIIRVESLLFFLLGSVFAIRGSLCFFPKHIYTILLLSGLTWFIISFYYGYCITNQCFSVIIHPNIWYAISKLTGLVFIWFVYDLKRVNLFLNQHLTSRLLSGTFFLFCFHEPLLTTIEKSSMIIIDKYNWTSYIFYFINPLFTIAISLLTFKFLHKNHPYILKFFTGYR